MGRRPGKHRAALQFMNDAVRQVRLLLPAGTRLSAEEALRVRREAAAKWGQFPISVQAQHTRALAVQVKATQEAVHVQAKDVHSQFAAEEAKQRDDARNACKPMRFLGCRFEQADYDTLAKFWQSPSFSTASVMEKREQAMAGPLQTDALTQGKMQFVAPLCPSLSEAGQLGPCPWAKTIILNRLHFSDCILLLKIGSREEFFQFMFAKQSPQLLVLSPLKPLPVLSRKTSADVPPEKMTRLGTQFRFQQEVFGTVTTAQLSWAEHAMVFVLPKVVLRYRLQAHAFGELVELGEYLRGVEVVRQPAPKSASAASSTAVTYDKALVAKFPAFARYIPTGSSTGSQPTATAATAKALPATSKSSAPSSKPLSLKAAMVTDEVLQAAFDAVEKKREEWRESYQADGPEFECSLLGGAWTKHFKGVAVDRVLAKAVGADSPSWCWLYSLKKQSSWSMKKYTEGVASELGMAWCHRMQYYYDIWNSQDLDDYTYTDADHNGYVEPLYFVDLQLAIPTSVKGPLYYRCQQIKQIRPTSWRSASSSSSSTSSSTKPVPPAMDDDVDLGLLAEDSD